MLPYRTKLTTAEIFKLIDGVLVYLYIFKKKNELPNGNGNLFT